MSKTTKKFNKFILNHFVVFIAPGQLLSETEASVPRCIRVAVFQTSVQDQVELLFYKDSTAPRLASHPRTLALSHPRTCRITAI